MSEFNDSLDMQALWEKYLAARDKAEQSRNINDGIEAGHAWATWLKPFLDMPA